jgi:hypothetical protein
LRKIKFVKDGNDKLAKGEKKYKLIPEKYTIWDYLIINKSLTIKEFINYIKKEYNVDVISIISNQIVIFFKNNSEKNIIEQKIEDAYNIISNGKLIKNKKYLMLEILGNIDVYLSKMPLIKYNFK